MRLVVRLSNTVELETSNEESTEVASDDFKACQAQICSEWRRSAATLYEVATAAAAAGARRHKITRKDKEAVSSKIKCIEQGALQ